VHGLLNQTEKKTSIRKEGGKSPEDFRNHVVTPNNRSGLECTSGNDKQQRAPIEKERGSDITRGGKGAWYRVLGCQLQREGDRREKFSYVLGFGALKKELAEQRRKAAKGKEGILQRFFKTRFSKSEH